MSDLEALTRLDRDIARAPASAHEIRFLVNSYYTIQKNRIRAENQARALDESKEAHNVIDWLLDSNGMIEQELKKVLGTYANHHPVGQWMIRQVGVGPVISGALLAYIDIEKAPSFGHIWAYAGLDPTRKWGKGEKRPWNANLKTLCWKIGESFVKQSGREDAFYAELYQKRKAYETAKNERGDYAAQAEHIFKTRKFKPGTDAYKTLESGRLIPAHIHERSKRYAVKIFLSHMWQVWREIEGLPMDLPYAIAHQGHVDLIKPPFWDSEKKKVIY